MACSKSRHGAGTRVNKGLMDEGFTRRTNVCALRLGRGAPDAPMITSSPEFVAEKGQKRQSRLKPDCRSALRVVSQMRLCMARS
jgi:hypothetical protein